MKSSIAHKARVTLIEIGKQMPFIICFFVGVSYFESLYALSANDFIEFGDGVYLNKPISWFLGGLVEYSIQFVFLATIISFAIQACKWNRLAILYLLIQLGEKSYFATHQWDNVNYYYAVIIINFAFCTFFVIKGLQRLKKH